MTERERKQVVIAIDDSKRVASVVVVDTLALAESVKRDLASLGLRCLIVAHGSTLDLVSFVSTLARHAH